ncbi:MAG: RICIN domain-containing protein [Firmicutes bacterium]|nr:RICIN domain-containing protein [Bacillota bacterium]
MTKRTISFLMSLVMVLSAMFSMAVNVSAAGVTPSSGNIYYIKNKNSGLYLTVQGDSKSNGANVIQATGTGSLGQRWILEKNSNGTFRLHPATDMTGGVSLDVAYGSKDNGANIQIYQNNSLSPQNFGITASSDGYAITTEVTNHASCLDVSGKSKNSGANVLQYSNRGADNQVWYFENAQWPSGSSSSSSSSSSNTNTNNNSSSSSSSSSSGGYTASKSWNFSDTQFNGLRTITSNVTVDGLTILANSGKSVSVPSAPVSGYNYCLALGGGGSTSYRAVSMNVSGSSALKVTAKSTGNDTRTLVVVNGSGQQIGSINCGSSLATGTVTINGTGTIYIYSTAKGINIYKIQLDTTGSVPGGGSSSSSGSSSSGSNNNNNNSGSSSNTGASNVSSAIDSNGYPDQLMEFVSTSDGKYVAANGSSIVSSGNSSTATRWKIVSKGSGSYQIFNAATGNALNVNGVNTWNISYSRTSKFND